MPEVEQGTLFPDLMIHKKSYEAGEDYYGWTDPDGEASEFDDVKSTTLVVSRFEDPDNENKVSISLEAVMVDSTELSGAVITQTLTYEQAKRLGKHLIELAEGKHVAKATVPF